MKKITSHTKINMIIGDPVEHSISPQIHNGVYKAMEIDDKFIFVAARVTPENLKNAIDGIRGLGINGITITVPHKAAVMEFLDRIDTTAKEIGAVNTIVNKNGMLIGYNTDYIGIMEPLKNIPDVGKKIVAVIGAGGAAHAAVFAAKKLQCKITIFNRTLDKAKHLAEKFNCAFSTIDNMQAIGECDVLINTTSVGLESEETPLRENVFTSSHIAFDVIYTPLETAFLKQAKEKGATIIHGTEMLLHQGIPQFELYTGIKPDINIMRKVMEEHV